MLLIGKPSIIGPCSMAMLNNQRVYSEILSDMNCHIHLFVRCLSRILSYTFFSGRCSGILSDIYSEILSDSLSGIT